MCTVPYNIHYYIWIYITTNTLLLRKKYNMTSYTYVGNSLSTFSTEGKQNTSPYLWETNVKSSTACCCITTRYHLRIFQQLSYFRRSLAEQWLIRNLVMKIAKFWHSKSNIIQILPFFLSLENMKSEEQVILMTLFCLLPFLRHFIY